MHVQTTTALVVTALAASLYLLTQKGDRLYPGIAVLASGVHALIVFKVMALTIARVRLDIGLAGLLLIGGAICWTRSSTKSAVAASTVIVVIALLQLLVAVKFLR
jgi:hypothetical protein